MRHEILLPSDVATPLGRFLLAGAITGGRGIETRRPLRVYGSYAVVCVIGGADGEYHEEQGAPRPVSVGSVLLVFPERGHWYGPLPGRTWDEVYLTFEGPVFDLWRQTGILDPLRPIVGTPSPLWAERFRGLIAELARPAPTPERVRQVAVFQALLADLLPADMPPEGLQRDGAESTASRWLIQARGLLEDDLARPADLAAIAGATGMSYETFRKRFQRETGISPARYRLGKRIEAAQRVLSYAPQMTNRQVALAFGFSDEFHFSRRFAQVTGISPSAFRKGEGRREGAGIDQGTVE